MSQLTISRIINKSNGYEGNGSSIKRSLKKFINYCFGFTQNCSLFSTFCRSCNKQIIKKKY